MASITSLMNSSYNTSSIYGNRNVLSGLASGMDTETMIENAVSGIKRKITSLVQKRTRVEWQQEAYRSIIDMAVELGNKYTSYASKTNLMSSSFFNNAVTTTANGTYAGKITASGKTSSDIKINAVKQLATAASYTVSGTFAGDVSSISGSKKIDLAEKMEVSRISGSITLQYGGTNGTSFDLSFDDMEVYQNTGELAEAIKAKLGDISYTYTKNGVQETVKASDVINVVLDDNGNIKFSDKTKEGNSVYISSATGNIKSELGIRTGEGENVLNMEGATLSRTTTTRNYLSGKTLTFSLNGTSKTINMSDVLKNVKAPDPGEDATDEEKRLQKAEQTRQLEAAMQTELDKAFGAGKVKAVIGEDGRMSFDTVEDGSTLTLSGSAAETLGFESGDSNFINTNKKISDLLSSDVLAANRLRGTFYSIGEKPTEKTTSTGATYYVDRAGNRVDKDGYRITDTDDPIYDFEINGAHISVTGDTTLESVLNSINSNTNAGVKVSYSKVTNEFKFTATETGSNSKIEMGGLAKAMFGTSGSSEDTFSEVYGVADKKWVHFETPDGDEIGSFLIDSSRPDAIGMDATMEDIAKYLSDNPAGYTATYDELSGQFVITDADGKTLDYKVTISDDMDGKENAKETQYQPASNYTKGVDAVMDLEVNGKRFENFTRSGNSFEIDGLTINVKGTFDESSFKSENGEEYEPVTFTTTTDVDTIVDAIRSFVDDYNALATQIKNAYSTMPAEKSDGSRYDPLTAEDEEGMTESAIKAYEEKAKQGILFGDTTLSSMYSKLLSTITPGGEDGQILREIGIGTSYSNGMTTISLNEEKLRAAIESDPEKVKNAFTKSTDGGSSTDGLMTKMQNTLDTYVKTAGEPKGVLINRAGSIKAYTSLNNNSLQSQINSIDNQIQRWQNKMSDQIDRYTTMFTRLEQLIAQMNSQASAMAGLMGGSEGYF